MPRNTVRRSMRRCCKTSGQITGPVVLGVAKRVYARLTQFRPMYNLVVSNVPGPRTHYFLGAEVLAIYPFGPVLHGPGLNITMWSVNGKLHVSLISCPELLPDLWDMADGFAVGLKELSGRDRLSHNSFRSGEGWWCDHCRTTAISTP